MVFNRIAVHMQKYFGQMRAKSKNGLKFDIGRLCSQPFNYCHAVTDCNDVMIDITGNVKA